MKKHLNIGIIAHVDAGKTTLSEALLYTTGAIRTQGRVDKKNAFLDTEEQERNRGITIYSKQAELGEWGEEPETTAFTLLDTPGHVDFSAEMERCLRILDAVVLVISAPEGVQAHTKTLWKLVKYYQLPTAIFVNKMDLARRSREELLEELSSLSPGIQSCEVHDSRVLWQMPEEVACCYEPLMEEYLETGEFQGKTLGAAIQKLKLFPCLMGSGLRLEGITELLQLLHLYYEPRPVKDALGAFCYKISRDEKGQRLAHVKITGGVLRVKDLLGDEKVNEIRAYSGNKYRSCSEAKAGQVVAIPGLVKLKQGEGIGVEKESKAPQLAPVLSYGVEYPPEIDERKMLQIMEGLEEELPELKVEWNEPHREIRVCLMGPIQTEVLQQLVKTRYGISISFTVGKITYKETIKTVVEGVGHFEPLRHYAEVHLKLEPLEAGSGMEFASEVREELLAKNWQRLILTHLQERKHKGVLTGSELTDMRITVIGGKAHPKHTEGGDFRQATYRAVRHGLMQGESELLEPMYEFEIALPEAYVGRAMLEIQQRSGSCQLQSQEQGIAVLTGRAPVATMHSYGVDIAAYTKGEGRISFWHGGYAPCHNAEEVLSSYDYHPEADVRNPASSVFCEHGAGVVVPWEEVTKRMHVPACLAQEGQEEIVELRGEKARPEASEPISIGQEEIEEILHKVSYANQKKVSFGHKGISARARQQRRNGIASQDAYETARTYGAGSSASPTPKRKVYLIDGYNVIFAWEELKLLGKENLDSARDKLLDYLCDFQGYMGCEVIVVFDAYKRNNPRETEEEYQNIHVVYTKTSQTADQYIERFANLNKKDLSITVVTSDGLVQLITRGEGCSIISSREFEQVYQSLKP